VVDVQVLERPVGGRRGGLGRDALALAAGPGVPADLDMPDVIHELDRRTDRPQERARRTVLHDPQPEAVVPVPLERALHPCLRRIAVERRRVPAHVLGIGEHRV
jgi:hypothetical protein